MLVLREEGKWADHRVIDIYWHSGTEEYLGQIRLKPQQLDRLTEKSKNDSAISVQRREYSGG